MEQQLTMTVPPHAQAQAQAVFEVAGAERASVGWEVRIDSDDAVPGDDVTRVVQAAADSRRVAVVHRDDRDDALRFLTAALEAAGVVNPLIVADAAEWPMPAPDCLILLDPGALPTALARRVARYVEEGGGVLTIGGPRTLAAGQLPSGEGVTGAVFETEHRVLVDDADHPLADGDWSEVAVNRALSLSELASPAVLSLVPTATGSATSVSGARPWLIERPWGAGRAMTLTTALDRRWSTLVLRPAFVGFIGNAVSYLAGEPALRATVGEPVVTAAGNVQLLDSDGNRVLALGETQVERTVALRVREPGLYTVRTPGKEALLAVNVDPRESDLTPMSAELLVRWGRSAALPARDGSAVLAEATAAEPADQRFPLAPALLVLAAILLAAETLAANLGAISRNLAPFRSALRSGWRWRRA